MIRDITIGQYYETDSVFHRLDPRVKLAFTIIYIISLYVGSSVWTFIGAALFLGIVIALTRVPVKFMLRGMKSILILLIISALFNLFLVTGEPVFQWKFITITKEGIRMAALMIVRLVLLVMGTSLMTLTATPNELTDGLEKSLGFLKVIHIPVHAFGMMMNIALRFIPILIREVQQIMKAQEARGADFESGGLLKKAKAMVPLLIPLFVSAFRRANDLAQAMEARCYHGDEGRTKLHPLKYERRDIIAYLILLLYLGAMIALAVFVK